MNVLSINFIEVFWMGIITLVTFGVWSIGLLYLYGRSLRETIEDQSGELQELRTLLGELALAAMAFGASNVTHPSTGPAVLQQLAKKSPVGQTSPPPVQEKTGVRVRQGAG